MFLPRSALHIARVNWRNRQVTLDLIARDFRLRYLGSVFGGYWNIIHPVMMIAIFTAVFSKVMPARVAAISKDNAFAYTIYLCAGLLPWNAFIEMVQRGTRVYLDNAGLIKKVAFPTEVLPAIVAGSSSITFFISITLCLLLSVATGFGVASSWLAVPLIFGLQVGMALGLIMITSVLNVFFRDMEQMVSVVFQIWFWLTPVVYLVDSVPDLLRIILYLNPFYYFIEAYHDAIVRHVWPSTNLWLACIGLAAGAVCLGASFLCHFKNDIPDEI